MELFVSFYIFETTCKMFQLILNLRVFWKSQGRCVMFTQNRPFEFQVFFLAQVLHNFPHLYQKLMTSGLKSKARSNSVYISKIKIALTRRLTIAFSLCFENQIRGNCWNSYLHRWLQTQIWTCNWSRVPSLGRLIRAQRQCLWNEASVLIKVYFLKLLLLCSVTRRWVLTQLPCLRFR